MQEIGTYQSPIGQAAYYEQKISSLRIIFRGASTPTESPAHTIGSMHIFGIDTEINPGSVTHGDLTTNYLDVSGPEPVRYQDVIEALGAKFDQARVTRTNDGVPGSDAYIVYIDLNTPCF